MTNAQGGASLKLFSKHTQLFQSDHLVWGDPALGLPFLNLPVQFLAVTPSLRRGELKPDLIFNCDPS